MHRPDQHPLCKLQLRETPLVLRDCCFTQPDLHVAFPPHWVGCSQHWISTLFGGPEIAAVRRAMWFSINHGSLTLSVHHFLQGRMLCISLVLFHDHGPRQLHENWSHLIHSAAQELLWLAWDCVPWLFWRKAENLILLVVWCIEVRLGYQIYLKHKQTLGICSIQGIREQNWGTLLPRLGSGFGWVRLALGVMHQKMFGQPWIFLNASWTTLTSCKQMPGSTGRCLYILKSYATWPYSIKPYFLQSLPKISHLLHVQCNESSFSNSQIFVTHCMFFAARLVRIDSPQSQLRMFSETISFHAGLWEQRHSDLVGPYTGMGTHACSCFVSYHSRLYVEELSSLSFVVCTLKI